MFQKINFGRAVLAGLAGTALMTALMLVAPMMGMPPMNIGEMLGSMMGGVVSSTAWCSGRSTDTAHRRTWARPRTATPDRFG